MGIKIKNTYGQPHHTSENNPTHVTGTEGYRLPLTGFLFADTTPNFKDMVAILESGDVNLHTRPEGYGLIFLESEEHSITYFGPIEQIERYRRENAESDGRATFDQNEGVMIARWPQGRGWDEFIPRVFWNSEKDDAVADGVGLVTAFEHPVTPGAEVIVYEFEGKWLPKSDPTPMVTYHCTACHLDTFHDSGHVHGNTGPNDRRWAARQARQHIVSAAKYGVNRDGQSACRPADPQMLRVVNEVARDKMGLSRNPLPSTNDAYCAVKGPCSLIRELRAGVKPAPYRG
ncbi:hypothetical protein ABT282_08375 [Streptomyces sp. NPDC000927]|uniref:hypothetical protein n=1 Tax=Streptomyces sp. NPDC000927 TaxID=3154371 RepID=UPI0033319DA8